MYNVFSFIFFVVVLLALAITVRTVADRPITNTHRTDEHGTDAGHFKGAGQG